MQNFELIFQYTILGIGATSGLLLLDNSLFLISDNSSFLYEYQISTNNLLKIKLLEDSQENIPKKDKLDFETITQKNNKLYIFGSGSTQKREERFSYNLKSQKVKQKSISNLYAKLKFQTGITDDELNIEGGFYHQKKLYLFQRGNGANSQNGIFIIDQNNAIEFITIKLPEIQNIQATFTDAILVGNKIYFLAAAENTTSTYNDGEILGSFFGSISLANLELQFCNQISEVNKFEGITFMNETATEINFLLCEDNDSEILKSDIFKLNITK